MIEKEKVKDIFSILHDGVITEWTGNHTLLTLTIECEYLAERIDKSFDKFYVDVFNVDKIEFEPWMTPHDLPTIKKTDLDDIFKAELDILRAIIENDTVVVICNQTDKSFDYCGGLLIINCQSIKIYDQNRNELSISQFHKICEDYWNELGNE